MIGVYHKTRILLSIGLITSMHYAAAAHPLHRDQPSNPLPTIIYCLSTPRSLSTAFFRMMEARGDCTCLEELGVNGYTQVYEPEAYNICYTADKPHTFESAASCILDAANNNKEKIIFVKEMGFAARHYLFSGNLGKINTEHAIIIFLVRNPHSALISLYRKRPEVFRLLDDWMNYQALWELFEHVRNTYTHAPLVIFAEQLSAQPEHIVPLLCEHCHIPFNDTNLHWSALSETMPPSHPWNSETGKLWYDRLLESTGFEPLPTYEVDKDGHPTFNEINNTEHRAAYRKVYEQCYPYYIKFTEAAQEPYKQHSVGSETCC